MPSDRCDVQRVVGIGERASERQRSIDSVFLETGGVRVWGRVDQANLIAAIQRPHRHHDAVVEERIGRANSVFQPIVLVIVASDADSVIAARLHRAFVVSVQSICPTGSDVDDLSNVEPIVFRFAHHEKIARRTCATAPHDVEPGATFGVGHLVGVLDRNGRVGSLEVADMRCSSVVTQFMRPDINVDVAVHPEPLSGNLSQSRIPDASADFREQHGHMQVLRQVIAQARGQCLSTVVDRVVRITGSSGRAAVFDLSLRVRQRDRLGHDRQQVVGKRQLAERLPAVKRADLTHRRANVRVRELGQVERRVLKIGSNDKLRLRSIVACEVRIARHEISGEQLPPLECQGKFDDR